MAEQPPEKLKLHKLVNTVNWYEKNLVGQNIIDPRGHRVKFTLDRFPYLIKLLNKSGIKVEKPWSVVERIKTGELTINDFQEFDQERAKTLSWIEAIVRRPTKIIKNNSLFVPGDEKYIKEFSRQGNFYSYKILICKRVSKNLLVPITSHAKSKLNSKNEEILWPTKN